MILSNTRHYIWYALLLAAVLCALPQVTFAFFHSDANATDNTLAAGDLALSLGATSTGATFAAGATTTVAVAVSDTGSIAPQVTLSAANDACAAAWFQNLTVEVTKGSARYQGAVGALQATSSPAAGTWEFAFYGMNGLTAADGEQCRILFTFEAHQPLFPNPASGGFTDIATYTVTLTASEDIGPQPTANVVLNEIYPNETATGTPPNDDEWIELYNGTGGAVDVAGYAISEETASGNENVYEVVASCPASGGSDKIAPFYSANTVIADGGLLVLAFCGGGDYLNNTAAPSASVADTVRLYNGTPTSTATMIDMHGYPDTPDGKSHARIPDGSDWVDPVPTPGTPNTATAAELRAEGWSEEKIAAVLPHLPPAEEGERAFRFAPATDDTTDTSEDAQNTGGTDTATGTTPAATSTPTGAATDTPAHSQIATSTDKATSTPDGADTATSTTPAAAADVNTATTTAATSTDGVNTPREHRQASTTPAAPAQTGTSTPDTETDSPPLQETARETRDADKDEVAKDGEPTDTPPAPAAAADDEASQSDETKNEGDTEGATDAAPAPKQNDERDAALPPEDE